MPDPWWGRRPGVVQMKGPAGEGRAHISVPFGPSALLTGMESQALSVRRNSTMRLDASGRYGPAAECV
jgi:hypothetical protein